MTRRAYAILCASFGVLLCVAGTLLFAQFFRFHAPGDLGLPLLPMGPNGHDFVAFTAVRGGQWRGQSR